MKLLNSFGLGEDICIDPGTAFTSIYIKGRGLVLREPSVVALDSKTGELICVGQDAYNMEERTPAAISIFHPVENGVITDEKLAGELFSSLISKVKKKSLVKPKILICVSEDITYVEKNAFVNAGILAGARQVLTVSAPVSAALGADCDITIARGLMVLDIGAGKSTVTAISVGNAVVSKTIKIAGNSFTNDIIEFMLKKHSLIIGTKTAEYIKEIHSVSRSTKIIEASGTDSISHLPRKTKFKAGEMKELFDNNIDKISQLIRDTLDSVPTEILGDILEDGILLVGGGARLSHIAQQLTQKSGIKLFPAEDIDLCTIKGAGITIENTDSLSNIIKIHNNV